MKQKKRMAYALLIAVLLSVFQGTPMEAEAGVGATTLNNKTLEGNYWNNPENDVVVNEGVLVFPNESTEYTRFITKTTAQKEEGLPSLVKMSASLKFNKLPAGKSFILAFGLSGVEALPAEANNVEVTFANNNGIKLSVIAYDENGTAVTVVAPKSCGMTLKQAATVGVNISTDRKISVSVNGSNVGSGTLPVSAEGRVGFLQTGECGAEISNLEVALYKYDRPENSEIREDFEKGAMDVSVLTSRAIDMHYVFPRGVIVEEHNGSQVLKFKNTYAAYVGTTHTYSNFEMTFDVPYIQTEATYAEDGTLMERAQTSLTVSFGGEQADWDVTGGWKKAADAIVFANKSVYSYNNKEELRTTLEESYLSNEKKEGFSIKLSVIDGVVTTAMKWMKEEKYQTVLTYEMRNGTPTGYIHIWATTAGQSAIDNLKIKNLDESPNLIATKYQSGKWEVPEDYAYEPVERVYAESQQVSAKAFSWYLLIPTTALVGVLAIAATALATSKKKNKKEAYTNEK